MTILVAKKLDAGGAVRCACRHAPIPEPAGYGIAGRSSYRPTNCEVSFRAAVNQSILDRHWPAKTTG
jgi:hypothetical protein